MRPIGVSLSPVFRWLPASDQQSSFAEDAEDTLGTKDRYLQSRVLHRIVL